MLGIMAGMSRWVSDDVPRAVLLLVVSGPRCPSSWLAWTTGQCGGSQVQFLDKVFYMPVVCYVWCHGPDSAVHCLAVPQLQFITVVDPPFRCAVAVPHGPDFS